MDGELSDKTRLKRFREEAKNICNKSNNLHNASLMATFAEKACFFGCVLGQDPIEKHLEN